MDTTYVERALDEYEIAMQQYATRKTSYAKVELAREALLSVVKDVMRATLEAGVRRNQ